MVSWCSNCGNNQHSLDDCPLLTNEETESWWGESDESEEEDHNDEFPYRCTVRLHGGKRTIVRSKTVEELWEGIGVAYNQSIYRDYVGIRKEGSGELLPPGTACVDPGRYNLVSRTHYWSDEELDGVLRAAVERLRGHRPLASPSVLNNLEHELLLQNCHFSLRHEGNSLSLDETRLLVDMIASKDWKHEIDHNAEASRIPDSQADITEAINHILISEDFYHISKQPITEPSILRLHSRLMQNLLHEPTEGLAGEYRKVSVYVSGDSSEEREQPELIEYNMMCFFAYTLEREDDERIFDYLARVHTEFQRIHPFRDGNGRMGRIMMNILLMQEGYPILVLPATLSMMYNHAVSLGVKGTEEGIDGSYKLFSRLLAEASFRSLCAYENAIDVQLLPNVEEVMGQENIQVRGPPAMVTPPQGEVLQDKSNYEDLNIATKMLFC